MKTICCLILGFMVSTGLFAQTAANPPAAAPEPMPAATRARIDALPLLFDGKTLEGWKLSMKGTNTMDLTNAWTVKDGAMASLGAGRSAIYTRAEYGNYRLIFKLRHVSGQPDHQACVLIYCTAPAEGEPALDALAGIQFQPPKGYTWDYRPGKNNDGKALFTHLPHPKFDEHEWSEVELLVNTNGTARLAVAQPVGTKAVEELDFNDPTAGKRGPIALQMHNKGLFDEYKDLHIEVDPTENNLITVK